MSLKTLYWTENEWKQDVQRAVLRNLQKARETEDFLIRSQESLATWKQKNKWEFSQYTDDLDMFLMHVI